MAIKLTVNPNTSDESNQVVLEHDRQVILDVNLEWSDGMRTTLTVYIHGTVLNPETGETSKTVTWELPPAAMVTQEQNIGMDTDMEGPPQ